GRVGRDAEDAWDAARDFGVPVLIKPRSGNRRRGTGRNLITRDEVEAAYRAAADETSSILVERFAAGPEWRLLVVGDGVAAAVQREDGRALDVTDRVHPEVADRAVEAARAVGLDLAGGDVVAQDI